jgi:hypothetical protein
MFQLLTTRSIVGAAIRQLERLTVTEWTESTETCEAKRSAQAEAPVSEASKAKRLASVSFRNAFPAATPQSLVGVRPNRLIVIWNGEELTASTEETRI